MAPPPPPTPLSARRLLAPLLLAAALLLPAARADSHPIKPVTTAVVAASACAQGQAQRPCTAMERASGGMTASSTCPCPYIDGVTGGPGPVRRFSLVVQHLLLPSLVDGLDKVHVTANGTIPGPAIVVDQGDWLEITVTNAMLSEPTTMHWHGQLQVMTPFQDGVPSMTQCAIQPGSSVVYAFRASNAGTYWYHGHMLEQYTEGLFGLLQVLPAPGSPEVLGAGTDSEFFVFLSDYYNNNAHDLLTLFYLTPESEGVEPIPDAIQANGLHKGELFMPVPSRMSKSLVHVICAAAFSMFSFSIDGVNLQVVELDSTAVAPFTVPSFDINVAQRVSFIVDWSTLTLPANASAGSGVFLRATAMTDMYALDPTGYIPPYESTALVNPPNPMDPAYTAVFQFSPIMPDGSGRVLPAYAANGSFGVTPVAPAIPVPQAPSPYAGIDTSGGVDTNIFDAVPVVPVHMPPGTHQLYLELLFWVDPVTNVNRGHFNGISHTHNMEGGMMPTLFDKSVYGTPQGSASSNVAGDYHNSAYKPFGYAPTGEPLPPLPIAFSDEAHYLLPPGAVVVVLINNTDTGEHPMHFHGHTFWILATSERVGQEKQRAARDNVLRRDTVSIPGSGWTKIAFIAENPGIWAGEHMGACARAGDCEPRRRADALLPAPGARRASARGAPRALRGGAVAHRAAAALFRHSPPIAHPRATSRSLVVSTLPHRVARRHGTLCRVLRGPRRPRRHARTALAPGELQSAAAGHGLVARARLQRLVPERLQRRRGRRHGRERDGLRGRLRHAALHSPRARRDGRRRRRELRLPRNRLFCRRRRAHCCELVRLQHRAPRRAGAARARRAQAALQRERPEPGPHAGGD